MIRRWSSVALGFDEAVRSTKPPSSQYLLQSLVFLSWTFAGKLGIRSSGENSAVKAIDDEFESELRVYLCAVIAVEFGGSFLESFNGVSFGQRRLAK